MAIFELLNFFKNLAIILTILFVFLIVYLYFNQNKMIYMPEGKDY